MKKARRRRNVVVKEVSLVDHPATKKKFVFFKSEEKKEVNSMKDEELSFDDPKKEEELHGKTEEILESLKESDREKKNLIKGSINSVNKVLSDISKMAGFTYSPSFKAISEDTALESEPAHEGPPIDEVVNAFDSVYGDGAATVKGVFQGLASVVNEMAASVGFKASMTFSKNESESPPEDPQPEEPQPENAEHGDKKKEVDEEELTDKEKELCDELEGLIEELSKPDITPERYTEILERKGAIEFQLKGGDK